MLALLGGPQPTRFRFRHQRLLAAPRFAGGSKGAGSPDSKIVIHPGGGSVTVTLDPNEKLKVLPYAGIMAAADVDSYFGGEKNDEWTGFSGRMRYYRFNFPYFSVFTGEGDAGSVTITPPRPLETVCHHHQSVGKAYCVLGHFLAAGEGVTPQSANDHPVKKEIGRYCMQLVGQGNVFFHGQGVVRLEVPPDTPLYVDPYHIVAFTSNLDAKRSGYSFYSYTRSVSGGQVEDKTLAVTRTGSRPAYVWVHTEVPKGMYEQYVKGYLGTVGYGLWGFTKSMLNVLYQPVKGAFTGLGTAVADAPGMIVGGGELEAGVELDDALDDALEAGVASDLKLESDLERAMGGK